MVMCCPLSEADETAEVWNRNTRTARKVYACEECRAPILPGQRYDHVTMLFDGQWSGFRTCLLCVEIGDHFACGGGRIVGELWNDLEENFFPDMKCGGPCMEGLSIAAKVRLIDARMEWLLGKDEAPNDYAWEDFAENPNKQAPRKNPYAPDEVRAAAARAEIEREKYFEARERELRWEYPNETFVQTGSLG